MPSEPGRPDAAAPPPPPRRPFPLRLARGALRLLAALLGLVAAVLVGGYLLLQTDAFKERVRRFALDRVREAVQGRVEVAHLRGDLLSGVTLEDVAITGPGGEPFLRVESLKVDYQIGGFLDQKVLLSQVVLAEPRVTLVRDSTGEWNMLRIFPFLRGDEEPSPPGGWGSVIRVEELRIVDGTVAVVTPGEARGFGPLGAAPEIAELTGTLGLDLTSGEEGRTRVEAEDLSFVLLEPRLVVRELDARATLTAGGLQLEAFHLRTARSDLAGEGRILQPSDPVLDVTLRADPLALEEARRFFPDVPFEGTLRGEVALRGPSEDLELTLKDFVLDTPQSLVRGEGVVTTEEGPRLDAELQMEPLAAADARMLWGGWPLEEPVRGTVRLEGTRERVEVAGDLAFGATAGSFAGTLGLAGRAPAYDLRATVRALDLQDFLDAPTWSSTFNGEFRIAGAGLGTAAVASFSGDVRDSEILFYDVVEGSFAGRFRPGAFEADTFHLVLPHSQVWGEGLLPYDYTLDLDLRAVSRDLQDFYPGIGPTPAARFEGEGTLSGPYSGLDLALTGTADSIAWKGLVADSLAATATFTDIGQAGFQMSLDGAGTDVDYLGPVDFETAEFHAGYARDTMGVTVAVRMDSLRTGEAHLDIEFAGATPRMVLDRGLVRLRTGEWRVEEPSGFVFEDGTFRFDDFALVKNGQRLALDGELRVDGAQDFAVEMRDVSLDDLEALAGVDAGVAGRLDASGRVTGTDLAPVIAAEFTLDEGHVRDFAARRLGGRVDYADRALRLDVAFAPETVQADSLQDPGTLIVQGTFPLDLAFGAVERRIPDRPMDLRVRSEGLTLALLEAFFPRVRDATGALELDVHLAGTPSTPRYQGEVHVRDGAFRASEGPRYTGLNGTARFDNDEIVFEGVRLASATGDARLEGRIAIRELALGDIEATLRATRFTLLDEDGRELVVDAAIDLGGTTQAPSITGRVNVEQLEWPLPESTDKDVIDLDEAILYVRAEGDTAAPPPAPDVWRQTLLDLEVAVEDDAFLRSDKALIVMQGDLTVRKARGSELPEIAGALEVVRGFYADFGTQFEVTEGEIFFYGTPEINPGLHIVATQTVRNEANGQDVDLTLTIGGTAEQPTLNVSSNPEYEKSEIFSLMLFGTPSPSDPGEAQRFENTVSRVATRQAALPLQRALTSELGLDLLEIQPDLGPGGASSFRVGKYVGSDVFITYTQRLGGPDRDESQFGVQYRLSRKWTIETHAGTRQFGADIFYEFRY